MQVYGDRVVFSLYHAENHLHPEFSSFMYDVTGIHDTLQILIYQCSISIYNGVCVSVVHADRYIQSSSRIFLSLLWHVAWLGVDETI
jgi:hypothetical protein